LQWDTAQQVGLGFNVNVPGGTPFTLNDLRLNLFDGTTPLNVNFPIAAPINFLSTGGGLGSGVFNFVLSTDEQTTFNDEVAALGANNIRVGITGNLSGLAGSMTVNFRGFPQSASPLPPAPPPEDVVPEIPLPASFPLFASGVAVMGLLGWRRKRKSTASVLAA
jgi:hypothetical protein